MRDMLTAHAFLSICQLRAKVDDVGESDLPASWKQEDMLRVFLPDNLSITLGACLVKETTFYSAMANAVSSTNTESVQSTTRYE